MDRAERRRAEREQRRQHQRPAGASQWLGWTPPTGRLTWQRPLNAADADRERQDFLAGTVFAAGAGVTLPGPGPAGKLPEPPPLFMIFVAEDASTFGPAPQLREAFRLLDEYGSIKLNQMLSVGTGWSAMDDPEHPLIKLKLEFHASMTGNTAIVLIAQNYARCWRHIVNGGMIGITTLERMDRAGATRYNPDPLSIRGTAAVTGPVTFADAMNACIILGIGTSPVVRQLMNTHGW